ncbi:MAG: methylenetetrahydrofolate reductase [NAD(P)H] [Candidatus Margulisiibacteriota bacterium]
MKVIEALIKDAPALSFEFFPPKTPEQEKNLFDVIGKLKAFNPDFVSITYGAMGTTKDKTIHYAHKIKKEYALAPLMHLTCVAADRHAMEELLSAVAAEGIENILALRGDPPDGEKDFTPPKDGFKYARDLVSFIKKKYPAMCVGVAGFPEGHPSTRDIEKDILYLKEKVDAGADFVITQLFFDNLFFIKFVEKCRKAGISVPIIPGLMPITSLKQINKMIGICGATIPKELSAELDKYKDDAEAIKKIGEAHTVKQAKELLSAGVSGIHYFVMNQSDPISQILSTLNLREQG